MPPKKPNSGVRKPSSEKVKRQVITISEKIEILELLKSGMSNSAVARKVGKNESSIHTIKKHEESIRSSFTVNANVSKRVTHVRDKVLFKVEKALNVWLADMSQKHVPVDGRVLREKAQSLYEHYNEKAPASERKEFKGSKGWLSRFVRRYEFKNLKITVESTSANVDAATVFPGEFAKLVRDKGYLPEQVFNCDETGLFWKKMANRTYIHKSAKQAQGFKAWKDRLTLVLCGNAASHMIKTGLIYRTNNPRALKNRNKSLLPVFWQHNKKAWMTAILFLEWFRNCFTPEVKRYLESKGIPFKVLLVIDNAPGHPESLQYEDDNVEVIFLPPNTTYLLQPLDQGIIKCMKATYTRLTFDRIRTTLSANRDCNITELWKKFTIADAIALIAESIAHLTPQTVNACWKAFWSDIVNNFSGFPTIAAEVRAILSMAKDIGGEGFSDMIEDDIEDLIDEHAEPLTNEELEEMLKFSEEEDEDKDNEEPQLPVWTLDKFAKFFHQVQIVKEMLLDFDPLMERSISVNLGITKMYKPIQDLYDNAKRRKKQLPITMFLSQSPVTQSTLTSSSTPQPSTSFEPRPSTSSAAPDVTSHPQLKRLYQPSESGSSDADDPSDFMSEESD